MFCKILNVNKESCNFHALISNSQEDIEEHENFMISLNKHVKRCDSISVNFNEIKEKDLVAAKCSLFGENFFRGKIINKIEEDQLLDINFYDLNFTEYNTPKNVTHVPHNFFEQTLNCSVYLCSLFPSLKNINKPHLLASLMNKHLVGNVYKVYKWSPNPDEDDQYIMDCYVSENQRLSMKTWLIRRYHEEIKSYDAPKTEPEDESISNMLALMKMTKEQLEAHRDAAKLIPQPLGKDEVDNLIEQASIRSTKGRERYGVPRHHRYNHRKKQYGAYGAYPDVVEDGDGGDDDDDQNDDDAVVQEGVEKVVDHTSRNTPQQPTNNLHLSTTTPYHTTINTPQQPTNNLHTSTTTPYHTTINTANNPHIPTTLHHTTTIDTTNKTTTETQFPNIHHIHCSGEEGAKMGGGEGGRVDTYIGGGGDGYMVGGHMGALDDMVEKIMERICEDTVHMDQAHIDEYYSNVVAEDISNFPIGDMIGEGMLISLLNLTHQHPQALALLDAACLKIHDKRVTQDAFRRFLADGIKSLEDNASHFEVFLLAAKIGSIYIHSHSWKYPFTEECITSTILDFVEFLYTQEFEGPRYTRLHLLLVKYVIIYILFKASIIKNSRRDEDEEKENDEDEEKDDEERAMFDYADGLLRGGRVEEGGEELGYYLMDQMTQFITRMKDFLFLSHISFECKTELLRVLTVLCKTSKKIEMTWESRNVKIDAETSQKSKMADKWDESCPDGGGGRFQKGDVVYNGPYESSYNRCNDDNDYGDYNNYYYHSNRYDNNCGGYNDGGGNNDDKTYSNYNDRYNKDGYYSNNCGYDRDVGYGNNGGYDRDVGYGKSGNYGDKSYQGTNNHVDSTEDLYVMGEKVHEDFEVGLDDDGDWRKEEIDELKAKSQTVVEIQSLNKYITNSSNNNINNKNNNNNSNSNNKNINSNVTKKKKKSNKNPTRSTTSTTSISETNNVTFLESSVKTNEVLKGSNFESEPKKKNNAISSKKYKKQKSKDHINDDKVVEEKENLSMKNNSKNKEKLNIENKNISTKTGGILKQNKGADLSETVQIKNKNETTQIKNKEKASKTKNKKETTKINKEAIQTKNKEKPNKQMEKDPNEQNKHTYTPNAGNYNENFPGLHDFKLHDSELQDSKPQNTSVQDVILPTKGFASERFCSKCGSSYHGTSLCHQKTSLFIS